MTRAYRPRPGSVPAKLLDWFKANPDEELTRVDVSSKFGLAPSTVGILLEAAVKGGALIFDRNDALEMVYRLPIPGEVIPQTPTATPTWPATESAASQRGPSAIVPPTPEELKTLVVETGKRPQKGSSRRGSHKWAPLLDLLDAPDKSVALRPEWVPGIRRYSSSCNKRNESTNEPARYYVGMDDKGAHRLWRLA